MGILAHVTFDVTIQLLYLYSYYSFIIFYIFTIHVSCSHSCPHVPPLCIFSFSPCSTYTWLIKPDVLSWSGLRASQIFVCHMTPDWVNQLRVEREKNAWKQLIYVCARKIQVWVFRQNSVIMWASLIWQKFKIQSVRWTARGLSPCRLLLEIIIQIPHNSPIPNYSPVFRHVKRLDTKYRRRMRGISVISVTCKCRTLRDWRNVELPPPPLFFRSLLCVLSTHTHKVIQEQPVSTS